MAGLTGRGVLPLLKLPNAGILGTQSYSTEVRVPSLWTQKFFSVANLGCLSRIPDSDYYPFRFSDQTPFFVATNITELKIILFLNRYRNNLTNSEKTIVPGAFWQKIVTNMDFVGIWDPRSSRIRKKMYPGSRGQNGTVFIFLHCCEQPF